MIESFLEYSNTPYALAILFINCFLSATILPLSSEILYLTLLKLSTHSFFTLWFIASIGNTLGGLTNLLLGRLFPYPHKSSSKKLYLTAHSWIRKHGHYALLLIALPLIGDILCLLAGWQRLNFKKCCVFLFLGKAGRYALISLPFIL